MTLIRTPLPEDLTQEIGVKVAFYDRLRVEMDEDTREDKPVLDEKGKKIYDLYAVICPNSDPYTQSVRLAKDSITKEEGKVAVINGYGESRMMPLTKVYKRAYDDYLAKKDQPEQLSESEVQLKAAMAKIAALEAQVNSAAKQNPANLENEAPKANRPKSSQAAQPETKPAE